MGVCNEVVDFGGGGLDVELWSCGIIMYYLTFLHEEMLITGEFPFNGSTKEEIFNKIKNEKIDFSSPKLNSVSDEYKDLL